MEFAVKNTYEEICANCGNRYITRPGRFPVCECGNTEPLTKRSAHGMVCDGNILTVIVNDRREASYSLLREPDYFLAVQTLYRMPILNGNEVRQQYLKMFTSEQRTDFAEKLKTWELLSHVAHYSSSPIYRLFFNNKMYACCRAVIEAARPRTEKPDNEEAFIKTITQLAGGESASCKYLNIVIDGALEDYDSDCIHTLAEAQVEVVDFLSVIAKLNLTVEQALRDISEFADAAYRGALIIEKMTEYYRLLAWFKQELGDIPATAVSSGTPIPLRLYYAQNVMRIAVANGVYATKKLLATYDKGSETINDSKTLEADGLIMRPVTKDEIMTCPLIMNIPVGGVVTVPLVILNGDKIESVIFANSGAVVIEGECDDKHKQVANKYFDRFNRR